MDKSSLIAGTLIGISASLIVERVTRFVSKQRNTKPDPNKPWSVAWGTWLSTPYRSEWAVGTGYWDLLYKDTTFTVGRCYSCHGPDNTRVVIVVTALYGPVVITNYNGVLGYVGHPTLALLKLDEERIFTNPLNMSWLTSILDPISEVYGVTPDPGWTTLYDTIGELRATERTVEVLKRRVSSISEDYTTKVMENESLKAALAACLCVDETIPDDDETVVDIKEIMFSAEEGAVYDILSASIKDTASNDVVEST